MYVPFVIMWPEALTRIQSGADAPPFSHRKFIIRGRQHVAIAGSSGAGKTRLWSTLTNSAKPDQMSMTWDDGYMVAARKRPLALVTVPGQNSSPRYTALDLLFSADAKTRGVIFVASAGYDHIWPSSADITADALKRSGSYNINGLRWHNLTNEQDNFREVCERISRKIETGNSRQSNLKWLMVLVNKADLYWDRSEEVLDYYRPGSGSPFDMHRQGLFNRVGQTSVQYILTPIITSLSDYRFQPSSTAIEVPSHTSLDQRSVNASLKSLSDNLEELHVQYRA